MCTVLYLYIRESCFLTQKCFIKKILSILVSMFLIYNYNWESEKVHYFFFPFYAFLSTGVLLKQQSSFYFFFMKLWRKTKAKKKKKKNHKEKHLNIFVKRFSKKSSDWSSLFQYRIWLFSFVCTISLSLFKASPTPTPHTITPPPPSSHTIWLALSQLLICVSSPFNSCDSPQRT